MDERQMWVQEMVVNALMNNNNKNVDMLQLIWSSLSNIDMGVQRANQGIQSIKKDTEAINTKIDTVLDKLNELESKFKDLKSEKRDTEEKLTLMIAKLSKMDNSVEDDELEDYYVLAQSLYVNWDELDSLTRKFIPLAEFLYSKMQKYDQTDYSPVILELCRAIENEFLLKIFKKYTLDLLVRKGEELDSFLAVDRYKKELRFKTAEFAKIVGKTSKTGNPEYTLGQMNKILKLSNDEEVVSISPLIQDFMDYLARNTEMTDLLDLDYIDKVNNIVTEYRNPSAHPEYMPIEKANECREIMPDSLDYFIDCIKVE